MADKDNRSKLAERLQMLRSMRKETQQDVANTVGITRSAYSMYETGKMSPKKSVLKDLAKHYNVSASYLRGEDLSTSAEIVDKLIDLTIRDKIIWKVCNDYETDNEIDEYTRKWIENASLVFSRIAELKGTAFLIGQATNPTDLSYNTVLDIAQLGNSNSRTLKLGVDDVPFLEDLNDAIFQQEVRIRKSDDDVFAESVLNDLNDL